MKKKYIILCAVFLLIPCIYKLLVRKNVLKSPSRVAFFTPNGSHVNIRTIIHEPGK